MTDRTPRRIVLAAALAAALTGCGGSKPAPGTVAGAGPLTVDAWKALPVEEKYSVDAFERLKAGDPKLETAEGWTAFNAKVVAPERRKDNYKPK